MIACAPAEHEGGFVATDTQWTFAGALDVRGRLCGVRRRAGMIVDLSGLEQADSSALAVMLALKRRAAASGARLQFASIPPGLATLASVYGVEELLAG
jgi:ABC-type transporter Mla MlaB component